jgi:tetratricopeptide (TPR) repeat protein
LRGRHEEALAELDRALDRPLPDVMKYYALLYAGRAHHTLGHLDAARQAFEGAKALYPAAQSPWLGLSEVARDEGNRDAALVALRLLRASPLSADRSDPLWVYRQVHDPTYEELLEQLRQAATTLRLEANLAMPGPEPTSRP